MVSYPRESLSESLIFSFCTFDNIRGSIGSVVRTLASTPATEESLC